ncbi:60S ribosomal protein L14-2 [Vitis vinifera]|uniref:60S ribosomal protein L14-2 n=1 Tax=Vitis vinifera TaxID=29760 RepID=A0A438GI02_VITVI|nr:60S ribosomal protein L14-2 [Vitis vinifera]
MIPGPVPAPGLNALDYLVLVVAGVSTPRVQLDTLQALVDAPDMVRCQMNFKRLSLTDIKIDIKRVPKKKTLIEAMTAADVKNKWENSSWGRKLIVQKRRASLNDFDRFKIMLAKIKRGGVIRQELQS